MNVRKRAESSTPAMPTTRLVGKPDFFHASCTIASSGLVTSTRIALRLRLTICSTTDPTISAFLNSRSSRVIPGLRARPAVMTTMSELAVSSYPLLPTSVESYRWMGPACSRSSALPCGTPSMTSTRTTSPSSFSTAYCATLAPTLPAPTTVILGLGIVLLIRSPRTAGPQPRDVLRLALQLRHVLNDGRAELRALHFLGALPQPLEVVRDDLRLARLLEARDDAIGRVSPAHVTEHHLARQNHRSRVDLVLARVLRRGAVRGLEQRVAGVVVDVGAGRDADAPDLRGQRVGQEIAGQVARGNHVELVRPREDLLQEGVRDGVLDEDLAGRRLSAAFVPANGPVAELALGQRVAPLHEHAFGVLLDVAFVDQRDVLAVVLDRVPDGRPDQPLAALLRDRLDPDGGRLREADLGDLHVRLQKVDHPLGFRRALLPLDAGVDVFRVLAEDHHVDLVRPFHR